MLGKNIEKRCKIWDWKYNRNGKGVKTLVKLRTIGFDRIQEVIESIFWRNLL